MSAGGKRIGLFGGTFDPVHLGHVIVADAVADIKRLDSVIFIPSARPPHKGSGDILFSAEERCEMLAKAVDGYPRFEVSDIEMKREGPSYTIDTIRQMKASMHSDISLFFIVGMDNLYDITMWKDPRAIVGVCSILAAKRICDTSGNLPDWLVRNVEVVDVPLIEISSSDIRGRIRKGRNYRYLVPGGVYEYIRSLNIEDRP